MAEFSKINLQNFSKKLEALSDVAMLYGRDPSILSERRLTKARADAIRGGKYPLDLIERVITYSQDIGEQQKAEMARRVNATETNWERT